MNILRHKPEFIISDEASKILGVWTATELRKIDTAAFKPLEESPEFKAERIRLRHVEKNPRPRQSIEEPHLSPTVTLSERIEGSSYPTTYGYHLWFHEQAAFTNHKQEDGADESTFIPIEDEADNHPSHFSIINRIAVGGLLSALAIRTRISGLAGNLKTKSQKAHETTRACGQNEERGIIQSQPIESSEGRPEKVQPSTVSAGAIVWRSFKKRLEFAPKLGRPDIDIARYKKIAMTPLKATINPLSRSYGTAKGWAKVAPQEKYADIKEWGSDKKRRKKVVFAAGSLALTGLALATVAYMEHKGAPVHGSSSAQEAATNKAVKPLTLPKEFSFPLPAQAVTAQIGHHAHIASEALKKGGHTVAMQAGFGYTQVIQKLFPKHTPTQYYETYKEAIKQLGPGFIKQANHYPMANGDYGLSGHMANVSQKTFDFLAKTLRANR